MHLRLPLALIAAAIAAIGVATDSSATLYTIEIEGVNVAVVPSVTIGTPNPILPGMFVGLGDCGQGVSSPCNGSPPIDNNPLASAADVATANANDGTNYSNAAIYGYGLPLDQVIFHAYSAQFNYSGGVVTPVGSNLPAQEFDFVVGNTGGGSLGFTNSIALTRKVRIFDPTPGGVDTGFQSVSQSGTITIGDQMDVLMILASTPLPLDLGSDGMIIVEFQAEGPIPAGDPDVVIALSGVAALPLPPTIALLGLGLGLLGSMRGRRRGRESSRG